MTPSTTAPSDSPPPLPGKAGAFVRAWAAEPHGRAGRALRTAGVVVFWLVVWQLLAWAANSTLLLSPPADVVVRFVELVPTAGFWASIALSGSHIVSGFLLAMVIGTGLAVAGAAWPLLAALLSPLMRALRAVPVVSFVLLVLIWADASSLSIIITFIMVMPMVHANVAEGCGARDVQLVEMAAVFGFDTGRRWWAITLPGMMPYVTAAARVGLGLCWKSGVSAEVIGLTSGSIGERLYEAKLFLSTGDLFCWTAVIVALAWVVEKAGLGALTALDARLGKAYAR